MAEAANAAQAASANDIMQDASSKTAARMGAPRTAVSASQSHAALPPLAGIAVDQWRALSDRSAEPNGYYLPDWTLAVNELSSGRMNVRAIDVRDDSGQNLIALMPAISAWRAFHLPLPAFVTADAWPPLGTILLERDKSDEAAAKLMQRARDAGAHALILRDTPLHGAVMASFMRALAWTGQRPAILHSHERAMLDATRNADELLREALGPKKLKELRRQRNRLAEMGDVIFTIASTPEDAMPALEIFLKLEASGWKARRGTALIQNEHDAAFIRRAVHDMSVRGQCEIVSLYAGATPLAAAIVLRHLDRAFYFKLGVDEQFAKFSPGVQLTLDLTRHMCADETIASVDSTAIPGHPMIDPIWRERLAIGDVLIPLYRRDPMVAAIRAALSTRRAIRKPMRHFVHFIRKLKEKRS